METTSLETSKKIWELSGWDALWIEGIDEGEKYPAYDLAYLLGKLPRSIPFNRSEIPLKLEIQWSGGWQAHYGVYDWKLAIADNPTEAAGKLVIALFEAGVLQGEK